MSSSPGDRSWTLLLLRGRGGRAFEWSTRRRTVIAVLAGALLATAGAGAAVGLAWAERREARRVAELRDRVRELRRDRSKVRLLAARLDSVEQEYRRIRQVMGGGAGTGEGDVGLPEAPSEESTGRDPSVRPDADAALGGWAWPLSQEGFVTRAHREGESEGTGEHTGMDVAVPVGSYVRAARRGAVEAAADDSVYGLFVRLRHPDGYGTLYGHNRWLFVSEGDSVLQGEVIALSGNSGRSTAPHLHFEVTRDERSIDPERLLGARMIDPRAPGADTMGGGP